MRNLLVKLFFIFSFFYLCAFAIALGLFVSVFGKDIVTIDEFRVQHQPALVNGIKVNKTWGHLVQNNSLGFRDKEILLNEADGKFRVLALGDSFTWGAGVPQESRYLNRLEDNLNEVMRARPSVYASIEIFNLALQGANTDNYLGLLKKYIGVLEPELVLVGLTYNDTNEKGWLEDPILKFYSRKVEGALLFILKASDPFNLFGFDDYLTPDLLRGTLENAGILRSPYEAIYKSGYGRNSDNWRRFERDLEEIYTLAFDNTGRKPIAFILTPSLSKKENSVFSEDNKIFNVVKKMTDQLENTATNKGFISVNSLDNFIEFGNNKYLSINNLDGHPNVLANQIYAQTLENYFHSKNGLLFR